MNVMAVGFLPLFNPGRTSPPKTSGSTCGDSWEGYKADGMRYYDLDGKTRMLESVCGKG